MSHELLQNYLETLSYEQKNFLFGFINLDEKKIEKIDWDMDQTLEITEEPIKQETYKVFNFDYRLRKVDGWDSVTKWLKADGVEETTARYFERLAWVNNELLMAGRPNRALQLLSYAAYIKGIPQGVTTVRAPGLRQTTYRWLAKHFPWIPAGNVNFRIGMNENGLEYKVRSILEEYLKFPGLIHVDDDLTIIKPLIEAAPSLGLIGIKYPSDDVAGLNHSANRVFVERDILTELIMSHNVIDNLF